MSNAIEAYQFKSRLRQCNNAGMGKLSAQLVKSSHLGINTE